LNPADMIQITKNLSIDETRISESFVRADGPGGQNINKTSSVVQLRYDFANDDNLPERIKNRLRKLASHIVTDDGTLIIDARRFRSQAGNRQDARERLFALLRQAAIIPKRRVSTKPSRSSREKRLVNKKQRGDIKKNRSKPFID
jgi:ribosome-associated protein